MATATQGQESATRNEATGKNGLAKPREKRLDYNQIHAKLLPVEVYPLPAFIPHNPLSIIRIAISILSPSLWRSTPPRVIHKAYFSPETQSVHITDPRSIRALWEQGFWGSGSLSRSEPRWLDQEKRKRGIDAAATSEEFTRERREERRQFKLERAKAQREAIEKQLREEGKLDTNSTVEKLVEKDILAESPKGTLYQLGAEKSLETVDTLDSASMVQSLNNSTVEEVSSSGHELEDQEHLQLTFEEAFFLKYVLGVLDILHKNTWTETWYLFRVFCEHSEFPYANTARPLVAPDNPFLLKYVVFHHFRSLGWVVRPGIKFACDFLLYLRGPAFHHAEFAVMIIPAYSDSYWTSTPELMAASQKKTKKDWWWLHRLNRVQSSVHKTLLLVHVEVPAPWDNHSGLEGLQLNIGKTIGRYKIRECILKRWSPNRNRD